MGLAPNICEGTLQEHELYYRARYYDPQTGRFFSEDPINFRAGIDFYRYVYNSPVRLRDPRGKDPVVGATVGAIVGGIYGGLGAAAQGGSLTDIGLAVTFGAFSGGLVGFLDPTLGAGTLALYGGVLGGAADLAGQGIAIARSARPECHPINYGSFVGAVAGGALAGALTPLYASGLEGMSVIGREVMTQLPTGIFGFGLTYVGGVFGEPKKPCGCN